MFTHEKYALILDQTFRQVEKLGRLKGGEYAGDQDRLANFRRNGKALGLPMEAVWHTYAAKHWDAITQSIRDLLSNTTRERLEGLEGRCDDLIVYLILFKCMLIERNRQPTQSKVSTTYSDADISVALRDAVWDAFKKHAGSATVSIIAKAIGRPDAIVEECLRRMQQDGRIYELNGFWWFDNR
jgi:hypothetical protein